MSKISECVWRCNRCNALMRMRMPKGDPCVSFAARCAECRNRQELTRQTVEWVIPVDTIASFVRSADLPTVIAKDTACSTGGFRP